MTSTESTSPSSPSSPKDIIHSVQPPTSPNISSSVPSPTSDTPDVTKPRRLSIFSPQSSFSYSRPAARLRQIFSPRSRKQNDSPDDERSSESSIEINLEPISVSNTSRRKRFYLRFGCCFPAPNRRCTNFQEVDYAEHLKKKKPSYVPDSPLLPNLPPNAEDRICLVLDLDETLVHSSFTPLEGADFEIPLDMQGELHTVYVKKRPGVDEFLKKVSESYEIVVFTASLALYANPVMDLLDPNNLVQLRLYREHCVLIEGCYVKDIAKLGRDLKRTVIIDNSPLSYALQPENAIPITAFFTDENDRELDRILTLLEHAKNVKDVRKIFG